MNHPQSLDSACLIVSLAVEKDFFMVFTQEHSVSLGLQRKTIYQQLFLSQLLSLTLSF